MFNIVESKDKKFIEEMNLLLRMRGLESVVNALGQDAAGNTIYAVQSSLVDHHEKGLHLILSDRAFLSDVINPQYLEILYGLRGGNSDDIVSLIKSPRILKMWAITAVIVLGLVIFIN
ncbi:hypothetical protein [Amphritea sp.]|uniref:hypothetical protein n=1 Tax=Amphritea sp. TaxID=1872502 RepID=UPI003D15071A